MKRKELTLKQEPPRDKHTALKWSGLQFRMTISYALTTLIAVLLVEIVLGATIWMLLTYGSLTDNGFMVSTRQTAKLYALAASAQAGGGALNPHATFQPGRPSSIVFADYFTDANNVHYISARTPDDANPAFALLITPGNLVLASSYPARYPTATHASQLLPNRAHLVVNALAGIPASTIDQTAQGRVVRLAETVWSRENKIIGAVYLQIPEASGGTLLQGFTLFWLISGLFWLVVMMLVGGIFGLITTRGLVRRLRHLVNATTRFASGDYLQRVQVSRWDEVGQLEQHFNQMAEQLAASTALQQKLAEQEARLEERARISRDLHDSVKQQVFATTMQIGAALAQLDSPNEIAHKHMLEAETLAYQAQQELTTLIRELRPLALQDNKGLAAVLRDYVTTWSRQQGIPADVDVPGMCALPLLIEEALLRIVQEALSNIARHSQATYVQIILENRQEQIVLSITDNGCGFDVAKANGYGVGLHSMQERMKALGGIMEIESTIGQGTRLTIQCTCTLNDSTSLR